MTGELRRVEELSPQECLRLLGSISLGRIVFTARALPAVRLASHLVDGGHLILRADRDAVITSDHRAEVGTVVAYQADAIDPVEHVGWSATVVGVARQVTDPQAAAAYRLALPHWAGHHDDQVIAIQADLVSGFRLAASEMTRTRG
jgi:Pyridoxamine 5'-phosphate oxidase